MDFPSANTFGLLPSRRTAIALSPKAISELANRLELFLLASDDDAEEIAQEGGFEVIFEPWDEELDSYVVADMDLDGEEDEDWENEILLLGDEDEEDEEDEDDEDDGLLC